jgi:hypothetical protein
VSLRSTRFVDILLIQVLQSFALWKLRVRLRGEVQATTEGPISAKEMIGAMAAKSPWTTNDSGRILRETSDSENRSELVVLQ